MSIDILISVGYVADKALKNHTQRCTHTQTQIRLSQCLKIKKSLEQFIIVLVGKKPHSFK